MGKRAPLSRVRVGPGVAPQVISMPLRFFVGIICNAPKPSATSPLLNSGGALGGLKEYFRRSGSIQGTSWRGAGWFFGVREALARANQGQSKLKV